MQNFEFTSDALSQLECEERTMLSTIKYPPHQHNYFEIEIYLSGKGKVSIDGKKTVIKRGLCSLIIPRSIHAIDLEENAKTIHLAISQNAISDFQIFNLLVKLDEYAIIIEEEKLSYIMSLIKQYLFNMKRNFKYKSMYLRYLLNYLLMEFIITANNQNTMIAKQEVILEKEQELSDNKTLRDAIKYINENYLTDISLSDVAEKCNLSKTYFSEQFHNALGVTFKKYIMDLRMNYAAKLLISSEQLSVSDISYMVGYESVSSFIRAFKAVFNMTPKEYISKNSEK